MSEPRIPFWAKCRRCTRCWPAAHYPRDLSAFAAALRSARCPACGGDDLTIARQAGGKLLEDADA